MDPNSMLSGTDLFIKVKNIDISYNDFGRGSIPVVFIHGFPFDKSMWDSQLDYLKDKHRVIAYDIRGYGKSSDDSSDKSISLFAEDLIYILDALQINKAIVCGLSMGGYIALNAINRFPDRFTGLILSDTQCIADSEESRAKRFKAIQLLETGGLIDFADGFVQNIFYKDSLAEKQDIVKKIEATILSTSVKTISGTLRALANRQESCSTLGLINIPTLIVCGKEDKITTVVQAQYLQDNIKNSTLEVIESAGHMSNIEQPEKFNIKLSEFLEIFSAGI